jgi:hypothetical protein
MTETPSIHQPPYGLPHLGPTKQLNQRLVTWRWLTAVIVLSVCGCGASAVREVGTGMESMTKQEEDAYVAETLSADAPPEYTR